MPDFIKKNYFCSKVMATNKRFQNKFILLNLFILVLFSSCSLLETDPVKVPAYIYVPRLAFSTTNNSTTVEGEASSKFVDVWIYDSGNLLGNIGLPALIPDQKTGLTEIEFDAGIMKSGQDESRIPYPFIARQTFPNHQLSPNKTDTFYPVFKYMPQTKFEMNEGFEKLGAGVQFTYNSNNIAGDTILKVSDSTEINSTIKVGKYCGKIVMAPGSQFFEVLTNEFQKEILQPVIGTPVYLELDYKSDVPINIIMWSRDQNGSVSVLPQLTTNPTSSWNKVYVCLDQDIISATPGTAFKISFRIFKDIGYQPNIFIDNIKLLHF